MRERFAAKSDAAAYGQRTQTETVHSMMKRNPDDCLRSALPKRREMMLRAVVHNLMLGRSVHEGRD